jgi:16S rRNA (cytosine1402-N4)-methyltransferase
VNGNFRDVARIARDLTPIDDLAGALLDLGVSSFQIDSEARGFSFRRGTPLNMRMGGTTGGGRTAADILNTESEQSLGTLFREYGEERRWRAVAREIIRRRQSAPFRTADDLVAAFTTVLGPGIDARTKARLFQALRIEVNDEMKALQEALTAIRGLLAPHGRFVVISYHSLEDRIVKNAFREWSRECICPPELPVCRCRGVALGRVLTRKPVRPVESEVLRNPRARSARLRAWEKS